MVVYICTKFHENILDGIKIIELTRFSYQKFQRGIIPSAHCLMVIYICTKIHENILDGIKADTIFIRKNSKGNNSVKNVGVVSVLVLCTLSDDDIHLYQVS